MQSNTKSVTVLAGSWDVERAIRVLSNACANSMVRGKSCPVAELALERLTASQTQVVSK
jgi:hypothetical protein